MSYFRGPDREQVQLLPASVEEYVPEESQVRFIDAFVEGLDLAALGFARAQPANTGRPPYHPADLLKLYLYGYLQRIRSSRRLEAEAGRNLELIWLLRGVKPDFKTIADFRKDNRGAFKPLFKQFSLLCRRLGLFGAELVAIDGSKFKASNNSRRCYSQKQLRELIEKIETRIDDYLEQLEQQDEEMSGAAAPPKAEQMREKLQLLKKRKGQYAELLKDLQQREQKHVALTDGDARPMKGPHGYVLGYNVQVAVDAKHDLIVVEDVVQAATDFNQLSAMAQAAKAELEVEQLQAVADKGYHQTDELKRCEQAGIEAFVPQPAHGGGSISNGQRMFGKTQFKYDPALDVYHCPAGQKLTRHNEYQIHGSGWIYYYDARACDGCRLRSQCTPGSHRVVARQCDEEVVERAAKRVAARPELVSRRKEIVEHVFGTLRQWTHDSFLMRGLEKVRAEFCLSSLVYNLRRVLNLMPLDELLKKLAELRPTLVGAG
jgi:transposase